MNRLDATELLAAWRNGSREALDALFPLVYDDLRSRAHRLLLGQPDGVTLSTTALVHESYLKLMGSERLTIQDRAHFLALAARAMRMVLVSYARTHGAQKRGGGVIPLELDEQITLSHVRADQLGALDAALERLGGLNERLSRTVELRFFGGLSVTETAEALGVTARTVRRDWVKAKAWLQRALAE